VIGVSEDCTPDVEWSGGGGATTSSTMKLYLKKNGAYVQELTTSENFSYTLAVGDELELESVLFFMFFL
jgi:hypothetical protein